jgi:hypothetical protein
MRQGVCARQLFLLAFICQLLVPVAARADIGPIQLISKSPVEQADTASETAISGDGRYVAFKGAIGGREGVFREDLSTSEILPVATGSEYVSEPGREAAAPSISADGRFVCFTTPAPLVPAADEAADAGGPAVDGDVYVADMSTSPPTYELVSARDGSSDGLAYSEPAKGSAASGRVAISADGNEVAFYTRSTSDLVGAIGAAETPSGEIALRNLRTESTTLVSVERNPLTGQMEPEVPVPGGVFLSELAGHEGASLSADGTTVAWLSVNLPGQVPLLPEEEAEIENLEGSGIAANRYVEPLWRRIGDGPEAPTRRIVGGSDPLAAGCPAAGSFAVEACQGPFPDLLHKTEGSNSNAGWLGTPSAVGIPQLSADGRTVALLGNPSEYPSDLFVVNMADGLTRKQAVKQWTFEAPSQVPGIDRTNVPLDGDIFEVAIDGAADTVALTTARQQFPGGAVSLIGSPPSSVGLVEVYLLDLRTGALQRVTHGAVGASQPSLAAGAQASLGQGSASVSLDSDGGMLAFGSVASNLILGDANEASDAFAVDVAEAPRTPGGFQISPPPAFPVKGAPWRMTLLARSLPNGRVRLLALVPGPGSLQARAKAAMVVGKAERTIGRAKVRSHQASTVRVTLALPRRLRHLAHAKTGFHATVAVSFRGVGGKPLRRNLEVDFRVHRRRGKRGGRS